VLAAEDVSLTKLRTWGAENPEQLVEYIRKDDSFVFFLEIDGPPKGSLNVDVSPGRTLATDKTLFPRGAIVFVDVDVPKKKTRVRTWWESLTDTETEEYSTVVYDRFMFDQDTGGAIRTAGRADIYMGIGDEAEWTAGQMRSPGQLYYLFLKERTYSLRP
jgi:membrane-bound lytic murein transglycosylase A